MSRGEKDHFREARVSEVIFEQICSLGRAPVGRVEGRLV